MISKDEKSRINEALKRLYKIQVELYKNWNEAEAITMEIENITKSLEVLTYD